MKFLLYFFILFFVFVPNLTFAVEAQNLTLSTDEAEMKTDKSESSFNNVDEYQLPYPGLLPDNPLYPIKTLRDRIVSMLISDNLKKAEFNLLQADKRLQAGVYLIDNKKNDLAIDTISKGENYFEEAIVKTVDAQKRGTNVAPFVDKLKKSVIKHKKIISGLLAKAAKENKKDYEILLKRVNKYEKEVGKIRL